MRKQVILSLVLLFTLSLFYSQLCFSQAHPLAGNKYGSLIFMKNLTTDDQADYSNDTCNFLETTRGILPDIWVRAFLKNNLQYYIDYMKNKHEKITYMKVLFAYTIRYQYFENGKEVFSEYGDKYDKYDGAESINIDKFPDYNANTLLFKLSEFENFANNFKFKSENLPKKQICIFKISCSMKFVCAYVNVLEKTKTDVYKDDKGWEYIAIKSEEIDARKYDYFKLLVK